MQKILTRICCFFQSNRGQNKVVFVRERPFAARAFSLVELLSVLAIVGILTAATGPAIRGLTGGSDINRSIDMLTGALELARTYAMTQHTYVRVGFSPLTGNRMTPGVGVLVVYAANGTLDTDTTSDMADAAKWPAASKPLILDNIRFDDSLNSKSPATNQDAIPSASDIGSFSRRISENASATFSSFIQFCPNGEARVMKGESARFIKLGMDRPAPQNGLNPFVVRLSGINGTLDVLRHENL